jgi:hypothetical protein
MTSITEAATAQARAKPVPLVLHLVAMPFIYAIVVPIALLDALVSLYQGVCFPIWSIPQTRRHRFLRFDRAKLTVLNPLQKLNCFYCSYANGVLAYATEVASKTEQYWCPIKHGDEPVGVHKRYHAFARHDGDHDEIAGRWRALRGDLQSERDD